MNKTRKLIVHMVGNAHLDPAWLWPASAGIDEALGTCRTMCDLLDEYPDLHVTRGEAWVYFQVQRLDPALFKRMAAHVKSGRLHVVNGWWVQPDCNLPRPESFLKQSEIGGRFFKKALGTKTKVGYNVDSFGHCGMLPSFLQQGGKDSYVFCRPGVEDKVTLPCLFRWRSPDGKEVLAFRPTHYTTHGLFDLKKSLKLTIDQAPAGIGHVMCFYGIGDHGGGPTREQIEWIQANKQYSTNIELQFSDPSIFFAAVKGKKNSLPVVTGELGPHAVGCYTAVRKIKREVRRAEIMLLQAEKFGKTMISRDPDLQNRMEEAWRVLLFNQFHDIMGGSSIERVCTESLEELGAVKSLARDLIIELTRKANVKLSPCQRQRIVVDNLSASPWNGHAEHTLFFQPDGSPRSFILQNEAGESLPFQLTRLPYPGINHDNILFPVQLAAGGRQVVEIRKLLHAPAAAKSSFRFKGNTLSNDLLSLRCGSKGISDISFAGKSILGKDGIKVCVFEDNSDTWSHGVLSYDGPLVEMFASKKSWSLLENGPIRAAVNNVLHSKSGTLQWNIQMLHDQKSLRMNLRLNWWGQNKIVKLIISPGFKVSVRRDGTPGAVIERALDKNEYPIMDIASVSGKGASLTAISPDIYAADVFPDGTMRITLLRSPIYAHHDPAKDDPDVPFPVADQGIHEYQIDIVPDTTFHQADVLHAAHRLNFPLWISDTTKGMPPGWRYDNFPPQLPKGMLPVTPPDAFTAGDLLKFAGGAIPSIQQSEKFCKEWFGEHLLVSQGSSLKLAVPIAIGGNYRISLARLAGKGFDEAELLLDGKHAMTFPSKKGNKPVPSVEIIPKVHLQQGKTKFEFKTKPNNQFAIDFLRFELVYQDIPANAWLVAGPFVFANKKLLNPMEGVEQQIRESNYPPEKSADLKASFRLPDGSESKWQSLKEQTDYIDFFALTGKMKGSIHYAATHIWSDTNRTAQLSFGVDFFYKIWLNEKLLVPFGHGNGAPFKGQIRLDVQLRKGWNKLMLKISSGSSGNGFWMAISDFEGLKFTNHNPPL